MAQKIDTNFYVSNQYLDSTLQPFSTFDELASFSNLFNGLNAVVTNGSLPVTLHYAYAGDDRKKYYWVIRQLPVFPSYSDLETTCNTIVTKLSTKKNASRAFYVGLEAVVQSGETSGVIEKYIVTEVTNGVPTWELEVNSGRDISTDPETVAEMLNMHETGNLVYTTGPVYSYESGDPSEIIYTADQIEAEGQPGYTEYPQGLYLVSDDSNGDVALSDVIINNSTDGLSIKVVGDDVN